MSKEFPMPDCLFCKIIDKAIPADILYEDDECIVFKDITTLLKDPVAFKKSVDLLAAKFRKENVEFVALNGAIFKVENLAVFVDIVQSSVLGTEIGSRIEVLANQDIRLALRMTREFLQRGYTDPAKALSTHKEQGEYVLPRQEAFRSILLGNQSVYAERFSVIGNPFDARRQDDHGKTGPYPYAYHNQCPVVHFRIEQPCLGLERGKQGVQYRIQRPDLGLAFRLELVHELPDHSSRHKGYGHRQEDERFGQKKRST